MTCSQARKSLFPHPDKCGLSIDNAAAMAHLGECASCRSHFEAQSEWARLLQAISPAEPAPEPLRERIAGQVRRYQEGGFRRPLFTRTGWVAAVAAVSLALPAIWLFQRASTDEVFHELCRDHSRYLNAESQVRTSDPAEIESWFQGKIDFPVRAPTLETAEILGARLCSIRNRRAALIFYRKRGRPVSLFEFSAADVNLDSLDRMELDGVPLWRMSSHGYSLAAYEHRGMIYTLVSDLRESELLELAAGAQLRSRMY